MRKLLSAEGGHSSQSAIAVWPSKRRTRCGCIALAFTAALAAASPQAHAADVGRPPETVTVDRQPQVPND